MQIKEKYKSLIKANGLVKLNWSNNYWDGPLEGMCTFQGERFYFECVKMETENKDTRDFILWKLTEEQQKIEDEKHALFEEHVGTHSTYDENGKRLGTTKPQENWHKFYDNFNQFEKPEFKDKQAEYWCTDDNFYWRD